jgi:hypothetical protein
MKLHHKLAAVAAIGLLGAGQGAAARPGPVSASGLNGVVMAFDRNSCPRGWEEFKALRGRVIVGVNPRGPSGPAENGLPVFDLANDYGSAETTVGIDQLPPHAHRHGDVFYSESGGTGQAGFGSNPDGRIAVPGNLGSHSTDGDNAGIQIVRETERIGGGRPVPLQPPSRALLFCKLL